MMIKIVKPSYIEERHLNQIVDLVIAGGEVKLSKIKLKEYIYNSDLVGYSLLDDIVICTATLKNPFKSYKTKVFMLAAVKVGLNYHKELGYISTLTGFEGKGYCSHLLKSFIKHIPSNSTYATTRKPAMVHILNKFNFTQAGKIYSNNLILLIN